MFKHYLFYVLKLSLCTLFQNVMSPSQEELQKISGSLEHLGNKLNNSLGSWASQGFSAQADGPQTADLATTVRKEINTEANKFTNKVCF